MNAVPMHHIQRKKGAARWLRALWKGNGAVEEALQQQRRASALARFEAGNRLVDHIDPAAALHHTAVFVTVLDGLQRVNDFHDARLPAR
jgi:hypothetical protein